MTDKYVKSDYLTIDTGRLYFKSVEEIKEWADSTVGTAIRQLPEGSEITSIEIRDCTYYGDTSTEVNIYYIRRMTKREKQSAMIREAKIGEAKHMGLTLSEYEVWQKLQGKLKGSTPD